MTQENEFARALFEGMAMQLLAIGTDDFGDKDFQGCKMGDLLHLQVADSTGEVCLQVVGGDSDEISEQLVLACLHNISIEHLGALHLHPLKRPLQALRTKEQSPS